MRMTITTQSRKGTTFTFDDVAAVLREQSQQRRLTGIGSATNPIALVNSNRADGKQQQSKLKCTQCGMTNPTIDKCYELIGYPKGHKLHNKQPINKQAANVTTIPTLEEEDDVDFNMCCRTVDDNGQAATVDESALSAHTAVRKETPTTGGTNSVTGLRCRREWQYWVTLPRTAGRGGPGATSSSSHVSEPPADHICISDALPTLNDDEQDEEEDEPANGKVFLFQPYRLLHRGAHTDPVNLPPVES
jgi:hypothetical protein